MPRITETDVRAQRTMRTEAILDAVEAILADPQDEQVSIARVAREVGLTRTGLYKYFPSMDAILEAVVCRHFPAWRQGVVAAMDEHEQAPERIVAYVRATIAQTAAGDHAWLAGLAGVGLGPEARHRIGREHRALTDLLRAEVERLDRTAPATGGTPAEDLTAAIQALTDTAVQRLDAGADPHRTADSFCAMVRALLP